MTQLNVSDGSENLFSVDVVSVSAYRRREKLIEQMLIGYLYEMKSPKVLDEMKQKVQFILDSDIQNSRKEKLEHIADIYNLPKYKNTIGVKSIDIKFVVGNEFNFD